jgi:hypothetical protein
LLTSLSSGFANNQNKLLAKPWRVIRCQQGCDTIGEAFANSRCSPVGEGNGNRADGVLLSPTDHMAVGEAFPTGLVFLSAKSSFPSLKTPTVLSQQERANPVGKASPTG